MTARPAHIKANPVEVSLLRLEAIVFVTKYLAHLLQQTLALGEAGDEVHSIHSIHSIKNMYETTELTSKNELSSGPWRISMDRRRATFQLIPSDILGRQVIGPSLSRWASPFPDMLT